MTAIPRWNFAELLTDSDVRELDGRGSQPGKLQEGVEGGSCQRRCAWGGRDDDEGVERAPFTVLAEDPGEADGGELHTEPCEAEGNPQRGSGSVLKLTHYPQRERGRDEDVRH